MLPGVVASHSKKPRRDIETRTLMGLTCSIGGRGPPLTAGAWRRPAHEHLAPVEILHEDADALALAALGL